MTSHRYGSVIACAFFALSAAVSPAQCTEARDAWLMRNYRFTGPPPPGSIPAVDPVVSDLRTIQNTLLTVMQRAKVDYDYEAALAAASQAAANAQLIGVITQRLESAAAAKTAADQAAFNPHAPVYSVALKDHTVQPATAIWADEFMLHYLTPAGAHVQVRLDLVDRPLTVKLNRAQGSEFAPPW